MTMTVFDKGQPKIIGIALNFPEFTRAHKKSVHSIYSYLRYSQIWSPLARLATPILDHTNLDSF